MGLGNFFENYLKQDSLFIDKSILSSSYIPSDIVFREQQIELVANILAPALRLERPSNLFVYGKTGTGKTLCIRYVLKSMEEIAQKNDIKLKTIYLNCKLKRVADTEYRLIAQLAKEFGKDIASTGLPTDEVYNIFYGVLDQQRQLVLLVLDEIDQLTKKIGDEILYNLTRINSELKQSQIALVGISNSLVFAESLDPRVKSSLSEEELIFPPYNALQIQDILRRRVAKAFNEGTVEMGVVEKCSAYAAREHGDVRRAIDLLRVAGELAERSKAKNIALAHLDEAERKVESDRMVCAVTDQPKQYQAILYAILLVAPQKKHFFTGEIYDCYQTICRKSRLNILTQRRVSDILAELDMLGIIHAKIISKGRYGRTREITVNLDEALTLKLRDVAEKALNLSDGTSS
ncbi:orc1/cdc6 family replication initiation protein [Candidatus Woesearchaeota archaeon]|nr:orc1/cdc6 family replication initiation protein [Candidatus Woesearchaeota archaeon]